MLLIVRLAGAATLSPSVSPTSWLVTRLTPVPLAVALLVSVTVLPLMAAMALPAGMPAPVTVMPMERPATGVTLVRFRLPLVVVPTTVML